MRSIKVMAGITVAALLAGCGGPGPEQIQAETQRLNDWFAMRFEEYLERDPMLQTRLGRKSGNDRINQMSEAAMDEVFAWRAATVTELQESFDYDLLSPEGQTSYDLWIYQHELNAANREFRRRGYLFHQMGGWHTQLAQLLLTSHEVDNESDALAYIARLREGARAMHQLIERAELASEQGVHAPHFAYRSVIEQSGALLAGAPFDAASTTVSALWQDFSAKLYALIDAGEIDQSRAAELRSAARAAMREDVQPAWQELIAWAESELMLAGELANGVWSLPEGEAFYAQRLATMTTTTLSADEIHQIGLDEVARILAQMEEIRERVGFAGTLQEFFAFLREDPQFIYSNNDDGRNSYLDAARAHLNEIGERLPEFFGLLPKANLEVRRVEAFRERAGQAQHYRPGTPDGSRPGIFYAHLIDMSSMPIPSLESIAYHEGLPGHHMQISIAQELTGIPLFRTLAYFTAYGEGWGLYAEALAKEMGGYQDPYSEFGQLSNEIWRAIRLVVDTGLHAKRWSQEEAVQYFLENSAISEGQIRAEVERYLVLPGQATAYKIGMLTIQELRARAQAELGERFDIRGFHDTVLGGGGLPLPLLEARVERWIAAQ